MSVQTLETADTVNEKQVRYSMRPGYLPTELGLLPEDWEVKTLSQIGLIKTGPFGTLLKASEYSDSGGVPLISVGEIREGYLQITEETPRVCEAVTKRLSEYLLCDGDIVFGRKGAVDRSALIQKSQAGWFLGSDGMRFRPHETYVAKYLAYQFQSESVQSHLLRHAIGTTMPSLNHGVLGSAVVPVPRCKSEQEAIAEALGDADALVESLERLLAKKRNLKQAAMQQLLTGKKRLPGFDGEWGIKKLAEIGEAVAGLTYAPSDVCGEGGTLVLRASNVANGTLVYDDSVYVSMELPSRVFVHNGDILICVRNGSRNLIGKCAQIDAHAELSGHVFGAFMAVFRSDYNDFVYHHFKSGQIKKQIHEHLGATINQITNKSLNAFEIPFPSREEQTAIAAVLSDMDAEIAAIEAKIDKARKIKSGMMQELLTGKTRLV